MCLLGMAATPWDFGKGRDNAVLPAKKSDCYPSVVPLLFPGCHTLLEVSSASIQSCLSLSLCSEGMQTHVPYTHLFCDRREGLQNRMTHVHTSCSQGMKTDRLICTSRFVRVIHSSCIVLIKPSTVTHVR